MPYVRPLPPGQNAAMVRGLSEQSRAMQARRNELGLATTGGPAVSATSSIVWTYPAGWPELQVNIGPAGACWVQYGCFVDVSLGRPDGFCGISIDGVDPPSNSPPKSALAAVDPDNNGGQPNPYAAIFGALTGLTPGFHTFKLGIQTAAGGTAAFFHQPFLMIWPA